MFDSGSTTDAVSPDFARVAKLPIYTLEQPMTLKLGCVGSRSTINYGTKATTKFASASNATYFDIANIDQYDAILGIPYMKCNSIVLDIPRSMIVVNGTTEVPAVRRPKFVPTRLKKIHQLQKYIEYAKARERAKAAEQTRPE